MSPCNKRRRMQAAQAAKAGTRRIVQNPAELRSGSADMMTQAERSTPAAVLPVAARPRHAIVAPNRPMRPEKLREGNMRSLHLLATALLPLLVATGFAVAAEKQGGILRMYHRDSPGSASIHEEATYSTNVPFMPVFNNLVMYKQDVAQNSLDSIVPELASSWSWSEDFKTLGFKLRQGIKWHD